MMENKDHIRKIKRVTHKPPRMHGEDAIYFATFCTLNRRTILLLPRVPEMLIENLEFYGKRLKSLLAYTVMPDHIHLLLEVHSTSELSNFLRDFKKRTSKAMKYLASLPSAHVWQRGTFDHCMRFSWSGDDLKNHVNYLFYNSWKHLNIKPRDFPYHNFNEVVNKGWLDDSFCVFDETNLPYGKLYE